MAGVVVFATVTGLLDYFRACMGAEGNDVGSARFFHEFREEQTLQFGMDIE